MRSSSLLLQWQEGTSKTTGCPCAKQPAAHLHTKLNSSPGNPPHTHTQHPPSTSLPSLNKNRLVSLIHIDTTPHHHCLVLTICWGPCLLSDCHISLPHRALSRCLMLVWVCLTRPRQADECAHLPPLVHIQPLAPSFHTSIIS